MDKKLKKKFLKALTVAVSLHLLVAQNGLVKAVSTTSEAPSTTSSASSTTSSTPSTTDKEGKTSNIKVNTFPNIPSLTGNPAFDSVIGLTGGIPIGKSVKYSFSIVGLNAYVVCQTSNGDPEVGSSANIRCACYVPGGWAVPPYRLATEDYTEGKTTTTDFAFTTFRQHADGEIEMGSVAAAVRAQVFNGTNDMSTNYGTGASEWYEEESTASTGKLETGKDSEKDGEINSLTELNEIINKQNFDSLMGGTSSISGGANTYIPPFDQNGNPTQNYKSDGEFGIGDEYPTDDNTDTNPMGDNTGTNPMGDNTGTNLTGDNTGTNPTGDSTGTTPTGDNTGTNPTGDSTGVNRTGNDTASGNSQNSTGNETSVGDYILNGNSVKNDSGSDSFSEGINSILSDNISSFNASDNDWASSGGGDGMDVNDYLSGALDDTGIPENLTNDLFGLSDTDMQMLEALERGDMFNADGTLANPDMFNEIIAENTPLYDSEGNYIGDGSTEDTATAEYAFTHGDYVPQSDDNYAINADDDPAALFAKLMQSMNQATQSSTTRSTTGQGGNKPADKSSILGKSDVLSSLTGEDAEKIRRNTTSDQELFELALKLLKEKGTKEAEAVRGKTYNSDSAWTDPKSAWDFNRITSLLKKKRVTYKANATPQKPKQQTKLF